MALVVESTSAESTNGNATVPKPAGLQAGDLMIAVAGSETSVSAPGGWTTLESVGSTAKVFGKIADSSDASASNFSFSGTDDTVVVIYRISGTAFPSGLVRSVDIGSDSATSEPQITIDMPINNDSILIAAFFNQDSAGDNAPSTSNYEISGTNPTWTEAFDSGQIGFTIGTAYANSPGSTNITYVAADLSAAVDTSGTLICVAETNDETGNHSSVAVTPAFTVPSIAGTAQHLSISPNINSPTVEATSKIWTNQSKSSTTWTNQSKS